MPDANYPRVVVVGAGFGGLWAARALARAPVQVLVIDRNNYHTFCLCFIRLRRRKSVRRTLSIQFEAFYESCPMQILLSPR